jgi:hypothetical protein
VTVEPGAREDFTVAFGLRDGWDAGYPAEAVDPVSRNG